MKIVVTGGAGFIGSHVVDTYIEAGHEVVVVDNLSTGFERHVNPKAKLVKVDIRDEALSEVLAAEKPELVNHHAAQVSVNVSMRDPVRDAATNVLGSLNLLECCRRAGLRKLIYSSTGGAAVGEPEYLPVDEDHPVRPLSPYGATKHAVEHYLYMYRVNHGLNSTILRYSNIYGPRQDPFGEAGVVAIFAGRMLRGEQPLVNGSGEQERDMLYVGDAAAANLAAIDKGDGELINVGYGRSTSVNEIYALLSKITGYGRPAEHGPALPGEVFRIYLDVSKAERVLGWKPRVGLEEGLGRTVDYFRSIRAIEK